VTGPAHLALPRRTARPLADARPAGWSAWRAGVRLARLAPTFFLWCALIGLVQAWPDARRRRVWTRAAARTLAARTLALLRVEVRPIAVPPAEPALYVANHLGWLDVLVAIVALPELRVVAKRDVAGWPLIGAVAAACDTVFIDRTRRADLRRAVPDLTTRLAAGTPVLLFPEGTTGDGTRLLPFRSALLDAAVRSGRPVRPLGLRLSAGGADARASRALCWTGTTSLLRHLPTVAGTPDVRCLLRASAPLLPPPVATCDRRGRSRARKALAAAAERAVARLAGTDPPRRGGWHVEAQGAAVPNQVAGEKRAASSSKN
jgi:1-acyl-sn-glycerol-3-phosphate acyltransferase